MQKKSEVQLIKCKNEAVKEVIKVGAEIKDKKIKKKENTKKKN